MWTRQTCKCHSYAWLIIKHAGSADDVSLKYHSRIRTIVNNCFDDRSIDLNFEVATRLRSQYCGMIRAKELLC